MFSLGHGWLLTGEMFIACFERFGCCFSKSVLVDRCLLQEEFNYGCAAPESLEGADLQRADFSLCLTTVLPSFLT